MSDQKSDVEINPISFILFWFKRLNINETLNADHTVMKFVQTSDSELTCDFKFKFIPSLRNRKFRITLKVTEVK